MKLAVISDIHGNAVSLSAVLADMEKRGADQVLCLGDVATLGPAPNEVIDTLRGLDCPVIMGNHDEFLLEPSLIDDYTDVQIVKDSVQWCREALTPKNLDFIADFCNYLEVDIGHGRILFAYHGDPDSHTGSVYPTTDAAELDRHLGNNEYSVMAGGHTHFPMIRRHKSAYFINSGSVGDPFHEIGDNGAPILMPGAEYAIVECGDNDIGVELRRVSVDNSALLESVTNSDNPLAGWFANDYARFGGLGTEDRR